MTDTAKPLAGSPAANASAANAPANDATPRPAGKGVAGKGIAGKGMAGGGAQGGPRVVEIEPPTRAPGPGAARGPARQGPAQRGPAQRGQAQRGQAAGGGARPSPAPSPASGPTARVAPVTDAPPAPAPGRTARKDVSKDVSKGVTRGTAKTTRDAGGKPRRSRFGAITFVLVFLVPTLLVAFYYATIAADQYRVEVRFAVRGVDSNSFSDFGLPALPGNTTESADSYIIADYIDSVQIIEDIRRFDGVDLRQFFARPIVDFVHRIDPATPVAKFLETWQWRTNVEYNSITGNTTFEVYAFTPEDARRIAALVLGQSERIVNELSSDVRESLISNAQNEVERTQERLREASAAVLDFRNRNTVIDPTSDATVENTIIQQLSSELADLETRRRALRGQVSANSPSVRVIDRQISAVQSQIDEQRLNIAGGEAGENLAVVVGQYGDLQLDQEFARTAYTVALESLETAEADARKQERYLATFVEPTAPDVSLHPRPLLYTLVGAFWFLICWAVIVFVTRSVRDHAI